MKKILLFLSKFWILILAGIIVLFLFISGAFDSCSKRHVDSVVNNTEIVELRHNLIDSVRKVGDKEKIRAIDSIQSLGKKDVARLKKKIGVLETDLQARIDLFDQDTTDLGDECDYRLSQARSILNDCQDINDTLNVALRGQELLTVLAEKKDSLHLLWYDQEKLDHNASDRSVAELRKELIKQTSGWKKNEKWMYMGVGVAIPVILKLILK